MGQNGSDVGQQFVSNLKDVLSLGPQRRAVSGAKQQVSNWISERESRLKNAYKSALQQVATTLSGPTRYDYSKSKLKVSNKQQPKMPTRKQTQRRISSAKSGSFRKGE